MYSIKPLPAAVALLVVASGAAAPTVAQQPDLVRLAQRVPVSSVITFTRLPEWVAYLRRHKVPAR